LKNDGQTLGEDCYFSSVLSDGGDNVLIIVTLNNNKNSSGDEIANVNFYAVRPEATRIR